MLLLSLLACAPDVPDRGRVPDNTITGTVVADGVGAGGSPAVLFLTPAANPPPPAGTGRPITLAAVPGDAFTGDVAGLQSAPFTFTEVPDGEYVITGVLDRDRDLHPLLDALSGATCGDVVGAHVQDLASGDLAPVRVSGGALVDDVTVVLGREMVTERPAFTLAGGVPTVSRAAAAAGETQVFRLEATGVHAAFAPGVEAHLDGPLDPAAPAPCRTAFLVDVRDADGDGLPDPHPDVPGAYDIGPEVYLQWLGELHDTDGDGAPDAIVPGDAAWAGRAVVHPRMLVFGELPAPGTRGLVPALDLVWVPGALQTLADGTVRTVADPSELPPGAWSVTVVQATGQTWSLPDPILAGAESLHPGFDPALQGGVLVVE